MLVGERGEALTKKIETGGNLPLGQPRFISLFTPSHWQYPLRQPLLLAFKTCTILTLSYFRHSPLVAILLELSVAHVHVSIVEATMT